MKNFKNFILVCLVILLAGCSTSAIKSDTDIKDTQNVLNGTTNTKQSDSDSKLGKSTEEEVSFIKKFLSIVKQNDTVKFRDSLNPEGIVIIRSFCSGNGSRGSELWINKKIKDIDSLEFKVENETSITFDFLLKNSLLNVDDNTWDIPLVNMQSDKFVFDKDKLNTIQDVSDYCESILTKLEDKNWGTRIIKLKDNQIAFYEGGDVSGFPTGGWLIFDNINGRYYLKAIMDLR